MRYPASATRGRTHECNQIASGVWQAIGQTARRSSWRQGEQKQPSYSLKSGRSDYLVLVVPSEQVKTLPPYPDMEVVVPDGHGWFEGDAPFNSEDSNHFGPVS